MITKKNLVYKGEAEFNYETGKIYRASKINLDITRIYQLDGFSDRVFNILWSGGFLMMNHTKTIDKIFNVGKELVVFHSTEEMKELCKYYLHAEKERMDIAERGQNRVKNEHTINKRIVDILSYIPVNYGAI